MSKSATATTDKEERAMTIERAGRYYDINIVASRAASIVTRGDADYQRIENLIYEFTSSCDRQEATSWMLYYMARAISYDGEPIMDEIHKDLCLAGNQSQVAAMFLAAYDIYKSLTERR